MGTESAHLCLSLVAPSQQQEKVMAFTAEPALPTRPTEPTIDKMTMESTMAGTTRHMSIIQQGLKAADLQDVDHTVDADIKKVPEGIRRHQQRRWPQPPMFWEIMGSGR